MANDVRNFIRFIGNEKVSACMREINERLRNDSSPGDSYGTGAVGRVLYGLEGNDAFLSYDEIGGKWIYYEYADDDKLMFVTGWRAATIFQDYLLSRVVQLDPNAIVVMDYDDEMPNFIGVRYVLMDDSEIQVFESELDTSDLTVVGLDDVEETENRHRLDGDDSKVIAWDDLWAMQIEMLADAYDQLKSEYPAAYPDPHLAWRRR
jgi:hypothetical protein